MKRLHMKHWLVILSLVLALLGTGAIATFAAPAQQKPTCLHSVKFASSVYFSCRNLLPSTPYIFLASNPSCRYDTVQDVHGYIVSRRHGGWQLTSQTDGVLDFVITACCYSQFSLLHPGDPPISVNGSYVVQPGCTLYAAPQKCFLQL